SGKYGERNSGCVVVFNALGETIDVVHGRSDDVRAVRRGPIINSVWPAIGSQDHRSIWRQRGRIGGGPTDSACAINIETNSEGGAGWRRSRAAIQHGGVEYSV